jgi:NADH-quinone oxidoreductase subunit J
MREGVQKYLPIGGVIGLLLFAELALVVGTWKFAPDALAVANAPQGAVSNTAALGEILYTKYIFWFQTAGLILLVAMIGAIVLTLRHKSGVKRQDIATQVGRTAADAMVVVKVEQGKGLSG